MYDWRFRVRRSSLDVCSLWYPSQPRHNLNRTFSFPNGWMAGYCTNRDTESWTPHRADRQPYVLITWLAISGRVGISAGQVGGFMWFGRVTHPISSTWYGWIEKLYFPSRELRGGISRLPVWSPRSVVGKCEQISSGFLLLVFNRVSFGALIRWVRTRRGLGVVISWRDEWAKKKKKKEKRKKRK